MELSITQKLTSNRTLEKDVPLKYKGPRVIKGITIHHWNDPKFKPAFDQTVTYLGRKGGNTSAHYVASGEDGGRVTQLVRDMDVAWHSGSTEGNRETIGIECSPYATPEDYETVAALVARLRQQYGDLYLTPHKRWFATACPGAWDIGRLDALARGVTGAAAPTPGAPPALVPDGVWGALTTRALQAALGVAVDGIIGPQTIRALQARINARGAGAALVVDGIWGPATRRGLQAALGVAVDGIIGRETVTALQRVLTDGVITTGTEEGTLWQ